MTEGSPTEPFKPPPGLGAIFAAAYNGLLHTVSAQRNMKVHWISGFMVMLVGMALELDLSARAALFFAVFLILFAEILNSALEAFVDLHVKQYHYQAKLAKDASAAGVLILAVAVVVLFADILSYNWATVSRSGDNIVRTLVCGLPSIFAMILLLFTRASKAAQACLALGMAALLAVLIRSSHDHFFSLSASLFLWVSFHARRRYPEGVR
jgi:diacylglycerol kinase (ATP)